MDHQDKTPGQVACEAFCDYFPQWQSSSMQPQWERAAKAVLDQFGAASGTLQNTIAFQRSFISNLESEILRKAMRIAELEEKLRRQRTEITRLERRNAPKTPEPRETADTWGYDDSAQPDPVNRPAHYTSKGIECIDAIREALGEDGFKAFCRGNVIKYSWRADKKGKPAEDMAKAAWYANKASETRNEPKAI
jgi:uncharacterized coiled-coil protein SlyX